MKKLLILSLMLVTVGITAPFAEAKSSSSAAVTVAEPQVYGQRRGRNWNRRRARTVVTTRIRTIGRSRYRETVRITYLPNGRTRTQVISRVRISGRRW